MYRSKFTLKIILLSILPIILFSIFSVCLISFRIAELSKNTSRVSEKILTHAYTQLLEDKSRDIAEKVSLKIGAVLGELNILRAAAQQLIDKDELHSLGDRLQSNPYIGNNFIYNPEKKWSNLAKTEMNISISVWGYLHDKDGSISKETRAFISLMTPVKMLMQIIGEHGTDKGWLYLTGPKATPVMIGTPWEQMPEIFDRKYPGHNEKNWWDFFFPGIIEAWNNWLLNPDFFQKGNPEQITLTPLYEDAGGTGLMVTFFSPLWNADRTENFGAAAVDYNLDNILNIVTKEKIGKTGFTFLLQSDGNILGLTRHMAEQLGLSQSVIGESGVKISNYNIHSSDIKFLSDACLTLSGADGFTILRFTDNRSKDFLLSFKRLMTYNLWNPKEKTIFQDALYVAAIVPEKEVFEARHKIHNEIHAVCGDTLLFLIFSSAFFTLISVVLAGWYAVQHTRQIRKMSHGVTELGKKNYDVSIEVISKDELGYLAKLFNEMIEEIRNAYNRLDDYRHDLENKVKERTFHLEKANQKLKELNQLDGLTKIHNRRYFDMKLEKIWREYLRLSHPVSVIMIDIDYFKKYNDHYGHQAGDVCLCAVATALKKQAKRTSDVIARYGGEEFGAIACVDMDGAYELAENMRLAVERLSIVHRPAEKKIVSISLGVASVVPSKNITKEDLVKKADIALYKSKASGRDMVSVCNT